jgi:hypothetical protein
VRCGCGTVGLSHSVKTSEGSYRKKEVWLCCCCFAAFLTLFSAVRGLASATFSIWQSTAEYIPTRPWSLPHWDSVRKGADSAEALDCQSLVSRQNSLVGVLRG